jgi:hypothetical protein
MLDHLEVAGHVFQDLALVLAEDAHRAAAIRTGGGRSVHHRLARQMVRQSAAGRLMSLGQHRRACLGRLVSLATGLGRIGYRGRRRRSFARLDLLDGQFELGDLVRQLLRRLAELPPAQPGKLHLQLLDLERLQLQRFIGEITLGEERPHHLLQALKVFRESGSFINHINMLR